MDKGISFVGDKISKIDMVIVAQLSEYTQNH